jgi:hypothetical protein
MKWDFPASEALGHDLLAERERQGCLASMRRGIAVVREFAGRERARDLTA